MFGIGLMLQKIWSVGPTLPSIQWVPRFLPGSSAAEAWSYHSPPRSGEVKNEWRDSSPPPIWPHGVDRESSWNVMAHGDAREGKWRGNWRMEWVASTLCNTSKHGVSSITTADAHTSVASSRLNWRPRRFKWTRPFRRKTQSGFCACAITFQTQF